MLRKEKTKVAKKQEAGMMTVEAVLCLVPFILAILGIISFINIYIVHSRIQYAMYQTANQLSAYTYLYEALGIRNGDKQLNEDADKATKPLDDTIDDVTKFLGTFERVSSGIENFSENTADFDQILSDLSQVKNDGSVVIGDIKGFAQDPKSLLRAVVYMGTEKAENAMKSLMLQFISKSLMEGYLSTEILSEGGQTADAWLEAYGVKEGMEGLILNKSSMFSDKELKMIDIVVEYDLEIYFFKLFMKEPTIHVVQRAAVPAWLDGDGGSYIK